MNLRLILAMSLGLACVPAFGQAATSSTPATTNNPVTAPAQNVAGPAANTMTLKSTMDKVSYAIGVNIGQNFKNQSLDVNSDAIAQGIKDGLSGATPLMSQQEMQSTLMDFQKQLIVKRQQDFQQTSTKNKQDGDAFLAANKTKAGVVTLPDGLQYKIIDAGSGASPTATDTVTVQYQGTFINGKIFDSSYQRNKPVTFPVSEIIPGWTEALKLMKPGATWLLFIPPNLAYGERGIGPIGPNETLLFKVNLISVTKGTANAQAAANPASTTPNSQ